MSRFFRQAGDSDSESEESDDELMSSGDDDAPPPRPVATTSKPAMSRFLRTAGSDSSSSDSDDDGDSDSDSDAEKKKTRPKGGLPRHSDSEAEDSDEEARPGVKIISATERRLVEMEATGKVMDNALKINDWVAISNEFDKLVRMIQRQHNVSEPIPPFYIRTLVGLEISLNSAIAKEKEAKKKMNATNAKALTAMRQKVKKAVKEYEKEVKQYQTDPTAFEREYAAAVVPGAPTATGMPPVAGSDEEPINDFVPVGKGGKAMQFTSEGIFKNLQAVQEARG